MSRHKSRASWIQKHINDEFVKRAQKEGYRSRAAYKLLEIQEKYRLIRKGNYVVDLGAAPGSWSQVAAKLVGELGQVLAVDILTMDIITGVQFIQGDFTEETILATIYAALANSKVNVVLSDMAPNLSGIDSVDQPKSMYLVELALDFALNNLQKGGHFVCKMFQGPGTDIFLKQIRQYFLTVTIKKPKSSRAPSREVYVVARSLQVEGLPRG
jgi:23S rRNA (uridine2552-2'-O)-methyltransferase